MEEREKIARADRSYEPAQVATQLPNEPYYQPQRRNSRRLIGLVLLIVGGLWLGSLLIGGVRSQIASSDTRDTVAGGIYTVTMLDIDIPEGDVDVQAWDQPTTQVDLQYHGGSPDDYAIQIVSNAGVLRISGGPKPCFVICTQRAVTYHIRMPALSNTRIKTTNGAIGVANLRGTVALETTNSAIDATNIANGLAVTAVNGAVELTHINGKLQANLTNGALTLTDSSLSAADVHAVNGSVELNGVSGQLTVENVNGDIRIGQATNSILKLSNTNGDISYEGNLASGASNTLNTVSGQITLELPETSAFTLNADTSSGTIDSEFELQNRKEDRRSLSGTANGGGVMLKIGTTNGDIQINQH